MNNLTKELSDDLTESMRFIVANIDSLYDQSNKGDIIRMKLQKFLLKISNTPSILLEQYGNVPLNLIISLNEMSVLMQQLALLSENDLKDGVENVALFKTLSKLVSLHERIKFRSKWKENDRKQTATPHQISRLYTQLYPLDTFDDQMLTQVEETSNVFLQSALFYHRDPNVKRFSRLKVPIYSKRKHFPEFSNATAEQIRHAEELTRKNEELHKIYSDQLANLSHLKRRFLLEMEKKEIIQK